MLNGITLVGTTALVAMLKAEGYEVNVGYVTWLIRDGHIPRPPAGPGGGWIWLPQHVAKLRSELCRRGRGPDPTRVVKPPAPALPNSGVPAPTRLVLQVTQERFSGEPRSN
jgi:hypothetical protein